MSWAQHSRIEKSNIKAALQDKLDSSLALWTQITRPPAHDVTQRGSSNIQAAKVRLGTTNTARKKSPAAVFLKEAEETMKNDMEEGTMDHPAVAVIWFCWRTAQSQLQCQPKHSRPYAIISESLPQPQ